VSLPRKGISLPKVFWSFVVTAAFLVGAGRIFLKNTV